MIENFEELIPLEDKERKFETADEYKAYLADQLIILEANCKEKLGFNFNDMGVVLSAKLQDKAEEISRDMLNIAPFGNFSKMLENEDLMTDFMKTEASKPNLWKIQSLSPEKTNESLIKFTFANTAIDEGDSVFGAIFISKSGVVRHSIVQYND